MNITSEIFKNLKESEEKVKKPYGDKPEEGKKFSAPNRKKASVPKGKTTEKFKINKLTNVNKQAADIYPSDTDKLMDKIDSKEQSDKGKIAKQNTVKAKREVNKPFGDKIQQSDSKLIKEGANCKGKECEEKPVEECDKKLDESNYAQQLWQASTMFGGVGRKRLIDAAKKSNNAEEFKENMLSYGQAQIFNAMSPDDLENLYSMAKEASKNESVELKEDGNYSYGSGLLKEIYNQYSELGMEDEFFEDCYNKMDVSEEELQAWLQLGECAKPKSAKEECDKPKPVKK